MGGGGEVILWEGPEGRQVFDKEPEGQDLGYVEDKYQGQGGVL